MVEKDYAALRNTSAMAWVLRPNKQLYNPKAETNPRLNYWIKKINLNQTKS